MIAVTGATGLLGECIVNRLVSEGKEVVAIARHPGTDPHPLIHWKQADVIDPVSLEEALQGVDSVIHAAAMVSFNPSAAKRIIDINVNGTKHIVDACLYLKIPRLIHISSVGALGKPKEAHLIDEESKWIPGPFNTDYAESKYLAELEVHRGQEEGLFVSMINPSVILAPGDWNNSSAKLFKFVWDEKKFYTQGQLNYVDVRDVTEMVVRLLQAGKETNGQKYIANSGSADFLDFFQKIGERFHKRPPFIKVPPSFINLAAAIESVRCRLTGAEPLVVAKTLRANRQAFLYDNQKAAKQLKMQFKSLEETLDWCCAHYLALHTTNK